MAGRKRGRPGPARRPSNRPRSLEASAIAEALWEAPVGIALLDTRLRFVRVNRAQAELDGLAREAHVGRAVAEVLPSLAPLLPTLERVALTGSPQYGLEVRDGEADATDSRYLQVSAYPIRGRRRRIAGICCMLRNVTARRRAQAAERRMRAAAEESATLARQTLRERDESMAVLDALFATAPVGLAVLDRELRFVRVNQALAEINGLPPEQHLGRALWEVVPGVASDALVRQLESVMDTCQPLLDQEVEGDTPAFPGQPRHWLGSWFPVSVAGRVIGVGLLAHEVTRQRQAEEFQRQLLGIVGHDLRSPLLAITSSAFALRGAGLGDREMRAVTRILSAADRMTGIIRALTDYSQVRVGQGIPLHRAPADLSEIARSVAEEVEAGHPGRTVECESRGDMHGEWDSARIAEILANLLGNALKYGAEGVPVRMRCRGEDESVVVEVCNEGPPIPPDFVPRLFEPFRRGVQAEGGKPGLGLGLFIASQIALAHGGSLEARSSEVEGTVFTLRLPRRTPPANESR